MPIIRAWGWGTSIGTARWRSAFALVGVFLFTALIPGHVVSQATALALAGEPGAVALDMPCHSGPAGSHDPAAPSEPSTPQKKCPFCKGYAAFMTALAGACDAGVLDAERPTPRFAVADLGHVGGVPGRPHNRGPPLEL